MTGKCNACGEPGVDDSHHCHLEPGDIVTLSGTLGEPCSVVSWRPSHHGRWYSFKSLDHGSPHEGYGQSVRKVVARAVHT